MGSNNFSTLNEKSNCHGPAFRFLAMLSSIKSTSIGIDRYLWRIHVCQSGARTSQRYPADEKDGQHEIRKHGRKVYHLEGKMICQWWQRNGCEVNFFSTINSNVDGIDSLIYLELTLPDDCIPFMTMKNTIIQLIKRQSTIHHLRPWPSSMDGAASKVVLYQKYAVSELLTHSSTGFPSTSGHFAHGSDF